MREASENRDFGHRVDDFSLLHDVLLLEHFDGAKTPIRVTQIATKDHFPEIAWRRWRRTRRKGEEE